jgi:archaellum component FlaG (FlaF/FlaG flagellin family)
VLAEAALIAAAIATIFETSRDRLAAIMRDRSDRTRRSLQGHQEASK